MNEKCQMTVGGWDELTGQCNYYKCGKPAKFKVPKVEMEVEYVCGIHARSINKLYKRTGQNLQCLKLEVKDYEQSNDR